MATPDELAQRQEVATIKVEAASHILDRVGNGTKTETVATTNGPVPSVAKFFEDNKFEFETWLSASGFESPPILYVDGATLAVERPTQLVQREGSVYSVRIPASFPYVLKGSWAVDQTHLVLRNDQAIRQDMADPYDLYKGASLIGAVSRQIPGITTLATYAGRYDGDTVELVSYHSDWAMNTLYPFPAGGGGFVWSATSVATPVQGIVVAVTGEATGRWVRKLQGRVDVTMCGARGDGTDDRLPFQYALNFAASQSMETYVPPRRAEWVIDLTLWAPSGSKLVSDGGMNKLCRIKAPNGHFTDLISTGVHNEGVNTTLPGRTLLYRNGLPYTGDNIGKDVTFQGFYINGNGSNAGYAPELGSMTGYRGCGLLARYVDGITVKDVFVEYAPNDCIQIARCRRISVDTIEVSRNFLVGNVIGGTRNGITIAGTLGGYGFSTSDFIYVNNVRAIGTEDLGIAIQFVTDASNPTPFAGTVNISNIFTQQNATYGTGVEIYGDGTNQPARENINISNVISIEDGQRTGEAYSSILISHRSKAVNLSDIIVRKARGHGITFSGSGDIRMVNIDVDEYNLGGFQNIKGIFGYQVAPDTPDTCQMTNVTVKGGGGRGGDTLGVSVTGYKKFIGTSVIVNETTLNSINDGAAIFITADYIELVACRTYDAAANGIRVAGFKDLQVTGGGAFNSGRGGGSAQKIGLNVAPGTNRTGRIMGFNGSDTQAVPTQAIGILLGVSATDSIQVFGCEGSGNTQAALVNLGMPNARVHNNGFEYTGPTLPLNIGGNGGYLSGRKDGGYHYWRDSFGMSRVKSGTATSAQDGNPYGLKVAVPASATAAGAPGQWAVNTGFIFVYTGDGTTHTWGRTAIASW